jgi:hypothetical protein
VLDKHSFFGIYRGICIDIADPLKKNRIRLQVPQVTGEAISDWAWPCLPVVVDGEHGTSEGLTTTSGASSAASTGTSSSGSAHTHVMPHTHVVTLVKHHTTPKAKQGVWVMFEGGDPNFPVWLGVF